MTQKANNIVPNGNDKSQWTSPAVWDLAVGRTQGGSILNPTEGLPVTLPSGEVIATTGRDGDIDLSGAS